MKSSIKTNNSNSTGSAFRVGLLTMLVIAGMAGVGCEGPTGPEGPVGPAGEDDNVMYSAWMDADWNDIDDKDHKRMQVSINELDYSDLRNDTLVMVYLMPYGSSSIYALPTNGSGSDNILYSYSFGSNVSGNDGLLISVETKDGTDLDDYYYRSGNEFRYILIPGSNELSTAAKEGDIPVDLEDYQEVKKYFGISD